MKLRERNSPTELKDYIRVYDNALDSNICKNIVKRFKDSPSLHERWEHDGKPQFTSFNITNYIEANEQDDFWVKIHSQLVDNIRQYSYIYMEDTNCKDSWPPENALEQIRLKLYRKGTDDRFDTHVDVGNHDSARRFLVMFWYLNTVDDGGETLFDNISYAVKPVEGRLLMFPPLWMYPHSGKMAVSDDKLILGTYLHYR